jgi:hypothetical protein
MATNYPVRYLGAAEIARDYPTEASAEHLAALTDSIDDDAAALDAVLTGRAVRSAEYKERLFERIAQGNHALEVAANAGRHAPRKRAE